MLRGSSHAWKVNFCKFTNETRLAMEDASAHSGIKFLAAVNGICAGGGYELALACDEILLVDDGNSAVSLPETPLLGVLPGTGGLTRVVDKRKVRRDLADVFGTRRRGHQGQARRRVGARRRRLADEPVQAARRGVGAQELGRDLRSSGVRPGITLDPLEADGLGRRACTYSNVDVEIDRDKRVATLTVSAPEGPQPVVDRTRSSPPAIGSGRCARSASWTTRCCGCG